MGFASQLNLVQISSFQVVLFLAALVFPLTPSFGQGQTLFYENFEAGAPGWVFENSNNGQWHIAPNGQCLSVTNMAAYNRGPAACNYTFGSNGNSGILFSPSFVLSGLPPYTISLDYIRAAHISAATCVNIVVEDCDQIVPVGCFTGNSSTLQSVNLMIPAGYEDRSVVIAFYFTTTAGGTNNPGFYVDNIEVTNSGIFGDFDGDLDVDFVDLDSFLECFTGSPIPDAHCLPIECVHGIFGIHGDGSGEACGEDYCPAPSRCGAIDCRTWDEFQLAWTATEELPELPQCERFGDITGDSIVNLADILCILTCFQGNFDCAGSLENADLAPCGGDGFISLPDILTVLAAFSGSDPCA